MTITLLAPKSKFKLAPIVEKACELQSKPQATVITENWERSCANCQKTVWSSRFGWVTQSTVLLHTVCTAVLADSFEFFYSNFPQNEIKRYE